MTERIFPILERSDLIVQTYDASLAQRLMDTETTPAPGSVVEFDESTVTFEGSFVRRGEPASDALLFTVDVEVDGDISAIATWLAEQLQDQPLARVETRQRVVGPDEEDFENVVEELLPTSEA